MPWGIRNHECTTTKLDRKLGIRNRSTQPEFAVTNTIVIEVDEHYSSCPCSTNTLEHHKAVVEITCGIWELSSTRHHTTDQNSVDKCADNFVSPAFVTIGRTKGQSETRGVADTLIDTTGLVFEDFTTPGKVSRRDLCLQLNYHSRTRQERVLLLAC